MSGQGLSYADLQSAVMFNTLSPSRYTSFVQRWLNDGVRDACRRLDLFASQEVAPYSGSTGVVTTAGNFYLVDSVWLATGAATTLVELVRQQSQYVLRPLPTADAATVSSGASATPLFYEASAQGASPALQLRVVAPASAGGMVAVTGRVFPAAMSSGSDLNPLGAEFDDALIAFCRARAFRYEDDHQAAALWKQEYEQILRVAAPQDLLHDDGPQVTPGTWGDGLSPMSGGG